MELYLKTDVLLLADVFESFRDMCLSEKTGYRLDPCHYFTAPGMAWDAALKMYGGSLELLTDLDMVLMYEKGTRGGISMISQRYAKANNKYMKDFDEALEKSYILYLDMNNLYGGAMQKALPVRDFQWESPEKFSAKKIQEMDWFNSEYMTLYGRGYTFMVDLEYPTELHDKHNDYPLAAEKMTITRDMVSPYNVDLAEIAGDKLKDTVKLVPNLHDKEGYVMHYMALKQCLDLGMVLEKIHKVISYQQTPWLQKYIDFNTKNRTIAKKNGNAFLTDFYKLMNNSVFGKTMENVRNRANLTLITDIPSIDVDEDNDDEAYKKMTPERKLLRRMASSDHHLQNITIFNENMVCISQAKGEIKMNKPIYCGQSILDISKTFMYDFHYNTMQKKYCQDEDFEKCKLLFTDTDSLCYHIKNEDLYKDLEEIKDLCDFSDYPKEHPLFNETNRATIGKMKDETNGVPIREYIGLKPKMYSYITETEEVKKAKGVQKSVVKQDINFNDYENVLKNHTILRKDQNSIRSYKHQIHSISQKNKIALNALDTKRWIKTDGISSYALGHHRISL
jgi:hypothetical protein